MDFTFTEEQDMLRATVRRFVNNEISIDYVRRVTEGEDGLSDEKWTKLAQLGCHGILIPEEFGGMDLSFVDLAVVLEELGKGPVPGPFISTVLLGGETIRLAGNQKQRQAYLPRIATGDLKATLAWAEPDSLYDLNQIKTEIRTGDFGLRLRGIKIFVPDANVADVIVCVAQGALGNALLMVDRNTQGVNVTPLITMDKTTNLCEIVFDDVEIAFDGVLNRQVNVAMVLSQVFNRINVAYALDMLGGAEKASTIGLEYAKIREQFGQPIGGFQVIKHRCADLLVLLEGARSIAYYAAWAQDHDPKEATIHASAAKAFCSELYSVTTREVLQILGGIGFSWENEIHIFLKRAKCLGALYGDAAFHRERLAQELGY